MSASTIIDTAPLGALIRYTDGSPKPPARFTKKLAAWERSNGVGRLVKRGPLLAGLFLKHDLVPRCAGHQKLHPQGSCPQP